MSLQEQNNLEEALLCWRNCLYRLHQLSFFETVLLRQRHNRVIYG